MLPRKLKIHPRSRVEYILKKGSRIRGKLLFLRFLPNRKPHHCFSVIASSKVSKKAVTRNLVRRRIYEAIRKILVSQRKPCYDIVVLTRTTASYADFKKDLLYCFYKLDL